MGLEIQVMTRDSHTYVEGLNQLLGFHSLPY
jgi:hypothetical protein